MPKVSVIIPVYNTELYLRNCLDCILNQTLADIEIICIDDGSDDGSLEILAEYKKLDRRLQFISQKNLGVSVARNVGLSLASGEYVYFIDSDDILLATALEEFSAYCDNEKLDILLFSGTEFFEEEELKRNRKDFVGQYLRKGTYSYVLPGCEMMCRLYQNQDYRCPVYLGFYRREFLVAKKICFYEGIIHEDNLYTFSALLEAQRVRCLNEIYVYRRIRRNSIMTRKETYRNLMGYYTCFIEQMRLSAHRGFSQEQETIVVSILKDLYFHVTRIYANLDSSEVERVFQECSNDMRFDLKIGIQEADELRRHLSMQKMRIEELENKTKNLERINDELNYHFDCMKSSLSFRIGRILTLIPRIVRDCIRRK